MRKWMMGASLALVLGFTACNNDDDNLNADKSVEATFENDAEGWSGELADYSTSMDSTVTEFSFKREALPAPLDVKKKALRIQSHNRSDDMFMFLKKKVTGLDPNKTYNVTFEIDLGTQYPTNSVGIGGSPGTSVYLKAGASSKEPVKVAKDGFYGFSLDKGNQATGGKDLILVGNVSNGTADSVVHKLVKHTTATKPLAVKPNEKGELWLCVGTDSGFEGLTVLYYDRIKAIIK
ncbi:hypothetical protein GVN16_13510 [Emticicia sp. CRIBPO]|uniref:hypothetical protein n=1 Tax=Emticicia sp. CRIBPO TaxID=2683258 RepID=UPI001412460E|nr:hypothetical protein [Emticicia sp. CRIBPO]NBA86786.1 hypothetical protein [Emticicia sp. CRIBPO]